MAGSRKNFRYTASDGTEYVINADESNVEDGNDIDGTRDYTGNPKLSFLPRNIKPRVSFWSNSGGTRVLRIPILTQNIFDALASSEDVPEIDDPYAVSTAQTLKLVRLQGERISVIPTTDTGLNDGDA